MTSETAFTFGLAAEDSAHERLAHVLVDRTLACAVGWYSPDLRRWCDHVGSDGYTRLSHVTRLARERGLRINGSFGGAPGALEARQFRALLLLFADSVRPNAVVVLRDTDGHTERTVGFAQARQEYEWPFRVVFGAPHPEAEAWVLAGFVAETEAERAALESLRAELGFSPVEKPGRLSSKRSSTSKRDTKAVLARLMGEDLVRQARCVGEADLERLRTRGDDAGLRDFLDEVDHELVPLVRDGSPT